MDKKSLLQKIQQVKQSTKEIMEGSKKDEQTTGEVKANQEESNQAV